MRLLPTAALAAAAALTAAAQEKLEFATNPEYASWAAVPKGTRIRVKVTTPGGVLNMVRVTTLKEVESDKVVLETDIEDGKGGGKPVPRVVQKVAVLLPGGTKAQAAKGVGVMGIPGTALDLPAELVTVSAGKYLATPVRWTETLDLGFAGRKEKQTTTHTAWLSDRVPGMVVKKVSITNRFVGARPVTDTFTDELIEVKKP